MRDVCWWCGGKLIWQSDFTKEEVFGEGEGMVTYLTCSECNAEVQYTTGMRNDIEVQLRMAGFD